MDIKRISVLIQKIGLDNFNRLMFLYKTSANKSEFWRNARAEMPAKTIVLFLIVVVVAGALLPTIAQSMKAAAANTAIAAVPGATVVLPLVSLMAIIILLMYGIKKAFGG